MSASNEIPQIAVTQEDSDDSGSIHESEFVKTDLEDLDSDVETPALAKLIQKKNKTSGEPTTDVEDYNDSAPEDSEVNTPSEKVILASEVFNQDFGVYNETSKIKSVGVKGRKKLHTQSSIAESSNLMINLPDEQGGITDCEEFDTDTENDAQIIHSMPDVLSHLLEQCEISENLNHVKENQPENFSNQSNNYFIFPSVSPCMNEITDTEMVLSDEEKFKPSPKQRWQKAGKSDLIRKIMFQDSEPSTENEDIVLREKSKRKKISRQTSFSKTPSFSQNKRNEIVSDSDDSEADDRKLRLRPIPNYRTERANINDDHTDVENFEHDDAEDEPSLPPDLELADKINNDYFDDLSTEINQSVSKKDKPVLYRSESYLIKKKEDTKVVLTSSESFSGPEDILHNPIGNVENIKLEIVSRKRVLKKKTKQIENKEDFTDSEVLKSFDDDSDYSEHYKTPTNALVLIKNLNNSDNESTNSESMENDEEISEHFKIDDNEILNHLNCKMTQVQEREFGNEQETFVKELPSAKNLLSVEDLEEGTTDIENFVADEILEDEPMKSVERYNLFENNQISVTDSQKKKIVDDSDNQTDTEIVAPEKKRRKRVKRKSAVHANDSQEEDFSLSDGGFAPIKYAPNVRGGPKTKGRLENTDSENMNDSDSLEELNEAIDLRAALSVTPEILKDPSITITDKFKNSGRRRSSVRNNFLHPDAEDNFLSAEEDSTYSRSETVTPSRYVDETTNVMHLKGGGYFPYFPPQRYYQLRKKNVLNEGIRFLTSE